MCWTEGKSWKMAGMGSGRIQTGRRVRTRPRVGHSAFIINHML